MANREQGYGFTAETKSKIASKYNPALEKEACQWIDRVLGQSNFAGVSGVDAVQAKLKDGVILCNLINVIKPGSVGKISSGKMAFVQMENIGKFLDGCSKIGMNKVDLFQTVDLYEGANMVQVIDTIHALGRKANKIGFRGPSLGPKEAESNPRNFTPEQIKQGETHIGLQMGWNKGASQAGQNFGKTRQILD